VRPSTSTTICTRPGWPSGRAALPLEPCQDNPCSDTATSHYFYGTIAVFSAPVVPLSECVLEYTGSEAHHIRQQKSSKAGGTRARRVAPLGIPRASCSIGIGRCFVVAHCVESLKQPAHDLSG
jgi:hypothetical protein